MKTRSLSLSLLFAVLLCTAFQCEDDKIRLGEDQKKCSEATPSWVDDAIQAIEANGWHGEVVRYKYHGEYVFLIEGCHECSDFITTVLSCNQEIRCTFGGIAGLNTCPDFGDEATHEKIIWKNY